MVSQQAGIALVRLFVHLFSSLGLTDTRMVAC